MFTREVCLLSICMLLYIIVAGVSRTEGFAAAWNILSFVVHCDCSIFCLVDRCLVVVWCYCCVPFSEEEKNNSCFVVIQKFAFLTLCWQLWVCPASPSCNATISFPARQPWASFFPLDFRRNAQNRFPSKKCIRFPTQGAHSSISWEAADDRVINTCHSSEAVIMLLLLLFFLFFCFFCCHSRWIQHLFRS